MMQICFWLDCADAEIIQHGLYSLLRAVRIRLRPTLAYPLRSGDVHARQWHSWWCKLYGHAYR